MLWSVFDIEIIFPLWLLIFCFFVWFLLGFLLGAICGHARGERKGFRRAMNLQVGWRYSGDAGTGSGSGT